MDDFLYMQTNGVCCAQPPKFEPRLIVLSGSVGVNGSNRPLDVRAVQEALNLVTPEQGGPLPLLVIGGICDKNTIAAIQKFQQRQFHWTDSKVDPGQKTIRRLSEIKTGMDSSRTPRILAALGDALRCSMAAQTNVLMAIPVVNANSQSLGLPSLGRESRMRLLNRHFDVDKLLNPHAQVSNILRIYDTMLQAFRRPGGLWGPAIFAPDPIGREGRAYTSGGGYFRAGVKSPKYGVRLDAIYLCEKLEKDTAEVQSLTLIHELAHFVAPLSAPIVDFDAQGWVDNPKMKKLNPSQRIRHAESYANFAFEAAYGRKPCGCD